MNNYLWRILYRYYEISKVIIKVEGVKEGGILSLYLFNFFIDQTLSVCTDLKVGAKIGEINLFNLANCDDIN
ncbi:hypothetical protein BpHYR1_048848 [Brachionus plicatilis]|uniref:RNA-directed DNA polymerase from mobile element jockey-like n=1 Tax=Brachionus plicatilis TaxID=10195 RepID=A0A3M7QIN5_BRAPC|nr:hypothetical protein BpHYR1_048848 [Brachionus plicatilis]